MTDAASAQDAGRIRARIIQPLPEGRAVTGKDLSSRLPWCFDGYLKEGVDGDPARYELSYTNASALSDCSELNLKGSISMHKRGHAAQCKLARRKADEARLGRQGRGRERHHGHIGNLKRMRRDDTSKGGSHMRDVGLVLDGVDTTLGQTNRTVAYSVRSGPVKFRPMVLGKEGSRREHVSYHTTCEVQGACVTPSSGECARLQ